MFTFAKSPGSSAAAARRASRAVNESKLVAHLPHAMSVPPIAENVVHSPGVPLDAETRCSMEARFGKDFGRVRVHTDPQASLSARAVNALAYTVGHHVVFRDGSFQPRRPEGRDLLAHELAHVLEQGATPSTEVAVQEPAVERRVLQRQAADETRSPPIVPPPQAATPLAPATPQIAAGAAQAAPAPRPDSPWTPDVPYIRFELLDFYRSFTHPEGPYFYYSYARRNRIDNPNFSNNLNPAPARDTTTVTPSGWRAQSHDLMWHFDTSFFVDRADAYLPPAYTRFETTADIRFAPTAAGVGFEDHFADDHPRYISPGGLSFPVSLRTQPDGFRARHPITQPGTLQWDGRLRVSRAAANADADVPARIDYSAPPGLPDAAGFLAALASRGSRPRNPAPGEPAKVFRVTISASGKDTYTAQLDVTDEKGVWGGTRRFQHVHRDDAINTMALVVSIAIDPTHAHNAFGSSSDRHLEIRASQQVRFASPAGGPGERP